MKKIFVVLGTVALGLGALSFINKPAVKAGADGAKDEVVGILRDYASGGKYIKKTQIFLNIETQAEIATHFHAGNVSLERTTYYDENVGGLLMGDYDGSFTHINSGYINDTEKETDCKHFRYVKTGENPDVSELFSAISSDWTAKNQRVGDYYATLSSLATLSDGVGWESFSLHGFTMYKHNIHHDAEQDTCFGKFQYFAAPMLLIETEYLTFSSVWVIDTGDFLSIRLYADIIDSGKTTMEPGKDDKDVLISEARVYKGISSFDPGDKWFIKGDMNGWAESSGYRFSYCPDRYNPLQFSITVDLDVGVLFKFDDLNNTWWGYDQVQNNSTYFWRYNDYGNPSDNNLSVQNAGSYTFYLQPRSSLIVPFKN